MSETRPKTEAIVILTEGFEDMEAVAPLDILRRGGVETLSLSITGRLSVASSHGVTVTADGLLEDVLDGNNDEPDLSELDLICLPGGPGHKSYFDSPALSRLIREHSSRGGWLAAICAAPVYLGALGLLEGREAVCYPGMEDGMTGAKPCLSNIAVDGKIITAKGPGLSVEFALKLLATLRGSKAADMVRTDLCI
ncbi:MAG: DJ-1/PfpI family protein [Clostridiales bacterium]|jgi:4-methyl-5(b-hydroxyethyl)-thiazole monophosphate biosynthesis|nr:DJ-1/PfpI family protein [Clostridiales bacterium]